eukprot:12365567-Heterocapsa_arctica.AAC.1
MAVVCADAKRGKALRSGCSLMAPASWERASNSHGRSRHRLSPGPGAPGGHLYFAAIETRNALSGCFQGHA